MNPELSGLALAVRHSVTSSPLRVMESMMPILIKMCVFPSLRTRRVKNLPWVSFTWFYLHAPYISYYNEGHFFLFLLGIHFNSIYPCIIFSTETILGNRSNSKSNVIRLFLKVLKLVFKSKVSGAFNPPEVFHTSQTCISAQTRLVRCRN